MTKTELRKHFQNKRRLLSTEEIEVKSHQICNLFFSSFDLSSVRYLHIFLPIARLKEVNTWQIIDFLQAAFPAIGIVFPKINPVDSSMESFYYDENMLLAENGWGITEPVQGNRLTSDKIDMVIVPLLVFDQRGFRVGYGKGFYDRFLATCRKDIVTIGLCYEEPVAQIDDINEYDIPMKFCITPDKLWQFGRDYKVY